MNFPYNENCPIQSQKNPTDSKIIKNFNFKYSSSSSFTKPNLTKVSKPEVVQKFLAIDALPPKMLKNIKIDYSKDNILLDKLFKMKNMVKIKKKSFI